MEKVYSFDVFDTLITRKVGLPEHIFLMTAIYAGKYLGLNMDPGVFVAERKKIENELAKEKKMSDDLAIIYERLAENIKLPKKIAKKIQNAELEIEYSNITGINKNIQLVKKTERRGASNCLSIGYVFKRRIHKKNPEDAPYL